MHKSRISRTLLAGTVLTAAPITALHAGTITESTDFGDTYGSATLLTPGTTQVNGTLDPSSDPEDWFIFQGLGAGTYTLSFTTSDAFCGSISAYSTSSFLGFFSSAGACESVPSPVVFSTGTVPGDGKLKIGIVDEDGAVAYAVSLDAPLAQATPEPSTFAAGLLAGGAMLWRRRRATSN